MTLPDLIKRLELVEQRLKALEEKTQPMNLYGSARVEITGETPQGRILGNDTEHKP